MYNRELILTIIPNLTHSTALYYILKNIIERSKAKRYSIIPEGDKWIICFNDFNSNQEEELKKFLDEQVIPSWFSSYEFREYKRYHIREIIEKASRFVMEEFDVIPDDFGIMYLLHVILLLFQKSNYEEFRYHLLRVYDVLSTTLEKNKEDPDVREKINNDLAPYGLMLIEKKPVSGKSGELYQ